MTVHILQKRKKKETGLDSESRGRCKKTARPFILLGFFVPRTKFECDALKIFGA